MGREGTTRGRASQSQALLIALGDLTRSVRPSIGRKPSPDAILPSESRAPLHEIARALKHLCKPKGGIAPLVLIGSIAEEKLRLIASSESPDADGVIVIPDTSTLDRLISPDAPLTLAAFSSDPLLPALGRALAHPIASGWVIPLYVEANTRGVVIVASVKKNARLSASTKATLEGSARLLQSALMHVESASSDTHLTSGKSGLAQGSSIQHGLPILEQSYGEFLEKIIQASSDAVIAADRQGSVIVFNRGAERISGYRAEEVIGKLNIVELYGPRVAREMMRRLRSRGFGGPGKLDGTVEALRTKDGLEIPIHISGAIIYRDGEEQATIGVFTDLRDILRLEKGIRESAEHYRSVVEQAHDGIGVVQGGKLRFANLRLKQKLGLPNRSVRNLSLTKFFTPEALKSLGLQEARGKRAKASEGEERSELETVLMGADGVRRVVEIVASTIRHDGKPARQIFVRDISLRKELEQTYRILVDTASEAHQGIILAREELFEPGAILYANAEFCRLTGWSLEELQKLPLLEIFTPEGLAAARSSYRATLRGEETPSIQRAFLKTKSGEEVIVEASAARTTYQGMPAIISYCRDVTAQARLEELIDQQSEALVKKNQELEDTLTRLRETQDSLIEQQKLAELGTFSAGIAHEIRNPLGLIRSHLRNVQETGDPLAQESAVRGIERQIRRTSDFIDKLLSYARPSAPMRRRIDVNRTVSMAARFASEAFSPKKEIELRREFEPDLPPILADHAQLQEVFINIITNALEAIGSRGIVWLKTARHDGNGVRIDIIDTGPGLQEEMISRIFQPFFTSGKGPKGTGMGLAIARRIVEGHRGQIEAVRASGAGMRFSVILPEESGWQHD